MNEGVVRTTGHFIQVCRVPGVGQLVKIHHGGGLMRQPLQNEIRADEASSARDQNWGFSPKHHPEDYQKPGARRSYLALGAALSTRSSSRSLRNVRKSFSKRQLFL